MTAPTTCSTHILDAALGRPAAGMQVRLLTATGESLGDAQTDADGRIRFPVDLSAQAPDGNQFQLIFGSGAWFAGQNRSTFYPEIAVWFTAIPGEHHHVALLLSPFAYTTYRGS